MVVVSLAFAPAAFAQQNADTQPEGEQPAAATTGGAEYGATPPSEQRVFVPGTKAVLMDNGYAAAPADAPAAVQQAVFAANEIVGKPYRYGGGHRSFKDTGYDCSGTISYALHGAKVLTSPLDSGSFMRWGEKGKGEWITVYTNPGHAFVVIAGLRLDTSAAGERRSSGRGPRWRQNLRGGRGFRLRHPEGL
jgi:cell wall-associated NlpC family hydrolase